MQIALKRVQALEPAGVGARSVAECLLPQLSSIEDATSASSRATSSPSTSTAWPRTTSRGSPPLRRTPLAIEAVVRPHPPPRARGRAGRFEPTATQYIIPDVIVRKVRGRWTCDAEPRDHAARQAEPGLRVDCSRSIARASTASSRSICRKRAGRSRTCEQRFSTILIVAEAILKRQQHFLEFGPMAMKPLGLREIATELGLHESTVSRVTNNKYMATPIGVFELKYFFSREMATASGGACSATAIRGVIKEMIDAEIPPTPLSDAQIARLLVRQGLKVARRTVTKYRQLLKVASVERRRRLGRPAAAEALA